MIKSSNSLAWIFLMGYNLMASLVNHKSVHGSVRDVVVQLTSLHVMCLVARVQCCHCSLFSTSTMCIVTTYCVKKVRISLHFRESVSYK